LSDNKAAILIEDKELNKELVKNVLEVFKFQKINLRIKEECSGNGKT